MNIGLQLTALNTIVRKEIIRIFRIWIQTILPPIINQTLYFVIFGGLIGSQIQAIDGVKYMAFIVPGLITMTIINNAFTNSSFSFFIMKFQRNIEEVMVAPVKSWVMIVGYTIGSIVRSLVVSLLIFLVSLIFVSYNIHNALVGILFMILTGTVFSLLGLINAIYANKFDDVNIIPTFVLTPLTYLGGVFYAVNKLPPLFQTLSQFNPIVYMVEGVRYGFFGISNVNVWLSLAVLTGFALALFLFCKYLLDKGIRLKS